MMHYISTKRLTAIPSSAQPSHCISSISFRITPTSIALMLHCPLDPWDLGLGLETHVGKKSCAKLTTLKQFSINSTCMLTSILLFLSQFAKLWTHMQDSTYTTQGSQGQNRQTYEWNCAVTSLSQWSYRFPSALKSLLGDGKDSA